MHRLTALALSVPCVLGFPVAAPAQSPSARASEYIHVITVTVKAGGVPAYEGFVKKVIAGAEKIGAPNTG